MRESIFTSNVEDQRRNRPKDTGFSLVEVMVALGIVSFAFISILGLVPMGTTNFRGSIDTAIGAQISQQLVNEAQQTDFNTLLTAQPQIRYFDGHGLALPNATGAIYEACARVSQSPVLPGAQYANENLATVTVQIANNPGNQNLSVDPTTKCWATTPGVSVRTFSSVVAGYSTAAN